MRSATLRCLAGLINYNIININNYCICMLTFTITRMPHCVAITRIHHQICHPVYTLCTNMLSSHSWRIVASSSVAGGKEMFDCTAETSQFCQWHSCHRTGLLLLRRHQLDERREWSGSLIETTSTGADQHRPARENRLLRRQLRCSSVRFSVYIDNIYVICL